MSCLIRNFGFFLIYVIESLSTYETATGSALYPAIISRWTSQNPYLKSDLLTVNTKEEFISTLSDIERTASSPSQDIPFLHLEIHGRKEGLVLASGELVSWLELADSLRWINIKTKHNLLISMATCHGAFLFSAVLPSHTAPCFAFIGSWEQLY